MSLLILTCIVAGIVGAAGALALKYIKSQHVMAAVFAGGAIVIIATMVLFDGENAAIVYAWATWQFSYLGMLWFTGQLGGGKS
jgi:hypothetical protein